MTQHPPRRIEFGPPKVPQPPPPPPDGPSIAERVERIRQLVGGQVPAEHVLEGCRAGLEHDQAIRADAAGIAATLLGDCSGTPVGIAARLVELATPIADWIRDGTPPEGDGACTCGQAAPPVLELDPACPKHGSQP